MSPSSICLAATLLAFSSPLLAGFQRCDGCAAGAMEQVALRAGVGRHIVADLYHGQAAAFDVSYEREIASWIAMPVPLSAQTNQAVAALTAFHRETGGAMGKTIELHAHELGLNGLGGAGAYDVLGDRNLRVRIEDRLGSGIPLRNVPGAVGALFETATLTFMASQGIASGPFVEVVVTFQNGTRMTFRVTVGEASADYLEGSARNANGEGLLEEASPEYAGTYHFPAGNSLDDFMRRAAQFGIPVVDGGTTGGVPMVTCSFNGAQLHCTIRRNTT
ncbi:hypothetical protein [Pseudomarimonas arenosa]|uniref:Uncharacterized protein n=1 Tax=Pseudomarimonas arenosa TaxID=2774145 RepID=A0AAW3ZDI2_9GAMM|nr:hypothetical protein [Pseudomarimonas arenosa]MBD8524251.1 hypothetical protein [Pseudomarimonas arenosa]